MPNQRDKRIKKQSEDAKSGNKNGWWEAAFNDAMTKDSSLHHDRKRKQKKADNNLR